MADEIVLGVDIGGTSVKAALVDIHGGLLVSERVEAPTPRPATVKALGKAVQDLTAAFAGRYSLVGVGFPATVRRGIALTAVNLHKGWVGGDLGRIFGDLLGTPVWAVNDADAAAVAEARFGAGRHVDGTVLVVTLGTGVGTTLVIDHQLVPNVELGLLSVRGRMAGERVSNRARRERRLSWGRWARDLDRFIDKLALAVSPDLIVIGGGVSARGDRFLHRLTSRTPVVTAALRNDAGIVGAARYAWDQVEIRRLLGAHPPQVMDLRPASNGAEKRLRRRTLHVAYGVSDLDRSMPFYSALGFAEVGRVAGEDGRTLVMLRLPEDDIVRLELVHGGGESTSPHGFSHLVVQVEDVATATAALNEAGVRVDGPQHHDEAEDGIVTASVTDPDGFRVELVQWPEGHPNGLTEADFR